MESLGNWTGYSFHGAGWSVREFVERVAGAGYAVAGIADWGNFRGAVEFSLACEGWEIRPVFGCRVEMEEATIGSIQLTARTHGGYEWICGKLTGCGAKGRLGMRALREVAERAEDVWISYAVEPRRVLGRKMGGLHAWRAGWERLRELDRGNLWIELNWQTEAGRNLQRRVFAELREEGWDRWVLMTSARHAGETAAADQLELLQSIGTLTRVGQRHPDKLIPGDYGLLSADELRRRFAKVPEVFEGTRQFAAGCRFDFKYGRRYLPHTGARTAAHEERSLRWRCLRGICRCYGKAYPWESRPTRVELLERLNREIRIVAETGYAGYFLIFAEIVDECERRGIPVLARGSAAGSLICHALGVGNVCPFRFGLSFERFLNEERMRHSKLPDIDLDLPWNRRDEIIQWVFDCFGMDHVAVIGGVATYQGRAAVVEVAKALGIPAAEAHSWSRRLPYGNLGKYLANPEEYVETEGIRKDERFTELLESAAKLHGLPRHPMMHPCGVVIADRPLEQFTPLEMSQKGFQMTQLDMHGVEALGLLKLDLLGQAGLSVLDDCRRNLMQAVEAGWIERFSSFGADALAPLDHLDYCHWEIYRRIREGGARGVFHIESPAMTGLLRQCQCADIDCLVATVSVIRPGAANEDKKAKFARRYLGEEPAQFADPSLEGILADSYGLLIYEEHILMVAHHFAGMDLGTADLLRRMLIKKEDAGALEEIEGVFRSSAGRIGREPKAIDRVWRELLDFSGFMFNKAHGAAYAIEAYQGCWMKLNWPLHFLAAVLNNQRGFYAPIVYVIEILLHEGRLRLPDVQRLQNRYFCDRRNIHLPLWVIHGLSKGFLDTWQFAVGQGPFRDWKDFVSRTRLGREDGRRLAMAGALQAWFPNRYEAVWQAGLLKERSARPGSQPDLFDSMEPDLHPGEGGFTEPDVRQLAQWECELWGFPVTLDPFALWMEGIDRTGLLPAARGLQLEEGESMEMAGIQVCKRMHRTRKGELMKFISLADESGLAEVVLFPEIYRKYGYEWSRKTAVRCRVRRQGDVLLVQ